MYILFTTFVFRIDRKIAQKLCHNCIILRMYQSNYSKIFAMTNDNFPEIKTPVN